MDLEDILKRLGWDDGFQIPIANVENKILEEQLAKLSLRKSKAKNELDRANSRLEGLKEHFKYVHQENDQNEKLITAHKQQYDAMQHYYHLTKSEKVGIDHDLKKMAKELQEVEQRQEVKKADLQKNMTKAEKLKTETEWDTEALKAWEETLKKKEDDIELIKKFSQEDTRKYNDLEARRQLLQGESEKRRKGLAKLVTDLRNNEMIIDRTGKVLKQQETERDALVKQWKEAVRMLQQRDEDVVKAQEQIIVTQELIEKQKEKLEEENGFLENERRNNHELDLEMESLNAMNSRFRRDMNDMTQDTLLLHSELHSLKRVVASTAQHLENERIKLKMTEHNIAQKEMMSQKFEEDIGNLKVKLEEMKDCTLSSAEKIRSIERMIECQEKLYNIFVADTEKVNNQLYRYDKTYKEQLATGKILDVELNNTTLFCAQLRKHIRNEKKELEKIKEVVYNMEYRIDEFEKRLLTIEYETVTDTHSEEMEKEIQELEQVLTDHKAVQHTLQTQVDRLREEMNRINTAIAMDTEQLSVLKDKCEQHQLENETSKKHIAAAKKSTQEKQVEENVMRLRISQIEKEMKREEKVIFSMEKLRLNLDQAMRERQVEINTNTMILQAKRRNVDEDRGRLRGEINLRRVKIEQLQKKYHVLLIALGSNEDGQSVSLTNYKIKQAQEKFFLQQEGDDLDQKIKTAEKEIVAMENTLKLVNVTNAAFKNSLAPIKDDDKEVQEMKMLEEEMKKTNAILRGARKDLAQIKVEFEEIQKELAEKHKTKLKIKENVQSQEEDFEQVKKQEFDKGEKLKRAECQVKRLLKKLENMDISKYNRDFEIKVLRDGNKTVLKSLTEMCGLYSEMAPLINRYTSQHNVVLPQKKLTWSSSSSSSSFQLSMGSCSSKLNTTHSGWTTPLSTQPPSEITVNKIDLSLNL